MKVLLIADEEDFIEKATAKLNDNGFDVITYRWLLKAMDNVEEIAPEVIIVSAASYPRHWKTLVSFVQTGLSKIVPKVILYIQRSLDNEEIKKTEALNICGIFNSIDENGLNEILDLISDKKSKDYSLIITNSKTVAFVTGKILSYENDVISFEPDLPASVSALPEDQKITQATLKNKNSIKYISAKIVSKINNSQKIKLQLI